jgi:predicted site-specific integrase-resolvase
MRHSIIRRGFLCSENETFTSGIREVLMATIGYARVSTRDQDLTMQREALTAAGCSKIYAEKVTGAKSDRPQLARLVKALEPGTS